MLISLQDISKVIGAKKLYDGLSLTLQAGEKVGMIGRNGIGKTTLLGIMDGSDLDFSGKIERRRGLVVASTAQEHHGLSEVQVMDYLLGSLPEYTTLKQVIDTYPETMGNDLELISEYSDALARFGGLGYFDITERAEMELRAFQLGDELIHGPLGRLSGGQKRMVELVKVTLSDCDLALIDEPTNHMDYVAKATFIKWLQNATSAVVVITHDRDVLRVVDRIIEIKDHEALSFRGNYDAYLEQNGVTTARAIDTYENGQKRMIKLEKQIREARSRKAGWSGTADKTNPFMLLERRLTRELEELRMTLKRPDFWIDQETIGQMRDKVVTKYEKYKSRNIRLGMNAQHRERELLRVEGLALGYAGGPLFEPLGFTLAVGERLELHGRNGAGKTTLVKAIRATASGVPFGCSVYSGMIELDDKLVIGSYEQEIDERYLSMPLGTAITTLHQEHNLAVSDQRVKQLLADYLFDPVMDARLEISRLSGGQKARFQLIAMLCYNPNLLILDEPTNHLDLPSIEELEKALERYSGAILYISHDSYFVGTLGGERLDLVPITSSSKVKTRKKPK